MKKIFLLASLLIIQIGLYAQDFVSFTSSGFAWIGQEGQASVLIDAEEDKGVATAASNMVLDVEKVSGIRPSLIHNPDSSRILVVGTLTNSQWIQTLIKERRISKSDLEGKTEKYILTTVEDPFPGVDEAVVIAGSDKRGAIYGIYELSRQIGVSPWYYWADVPVEKHPTISFIKGTYTEGEPAVRYRGIFLNDEWPCLGNWASRSFGGFNSKFYEKVFELVLRLKGNFMWPAMWASAFYDDDPRNGKLANEMGIIMGTSHHEPMALAQRDWKKRGTGAWNYQTNKKGLDEFWKYGITRSNKWERVVTVGMRGDGDEPMSENANVQLLTDVVKNQRRIIERVTGKKASETPQVWALYKEVTDYYDKGMRVPDDITLLLCDDNWGNVRRLPSLTSKPRKGGYGMYYHVDYVGAPRNTKWINVTPIQNLWEQMELAYDYGVDRLWILNVGDLKPMEYPISLFLDMAWNPKKYTVDNLLDHTRRFCAQQFGANQAVEAARILNLYCKYAGRVTPEMLDRNTYNLETGEWKSVADDFVKLEAEALRQFLTLQPSYRDAYKELILFPVQAMANLYEMYYAQAMNHKLYKENNPMANDWAEKVETSFRRDSMLCADYNLNIAQGKWNGIMTQNHIGYTSWNDNFKKNNLPQVFRISNPEQALGGYIFTAQNGVVSMEAEHYYKATDAKEAHWTVMPYMGRTLSGMALRPYTKSTGGGVLAYKMRMPRDVKEVTVHIVVKSTLDFLHKGGFTYKVAFEGGEQKVVNFNSNLNEDPDNVYSVFYPTVARRVVEKKVKMSVPVSPDGMQTLLLSPDDPGIVFEKIVVDCGGYKNAYLFMDESPCSR